MFLSASRIKAFLTCSWQFYCTYNLGMRDIDGGNDGAKRGTITHLILELLLKPRHQKYIHQVLKSSALKVKPINRLILKHAKILNVDDQDNLNLISKFINTGLLTDYFCDGFDLQETEWAFKIENESPRYKIAGFLDKHAFPLEGSSKYRIDDYKTSKSKFSGKDVSFNIQALTYALALWKEKGAEDIDVNFIFLKFHKQPWQKFNFKSDHLLGFEVYLENIYSYLENFTAKKACSRFGADNPETFRLCGKSKGDLKADGSPAWICALKYPFLYFELKSKEGKIISTNKSIEPLEKLKKEGETISEKMYVGCPRWHGRM